MAAAAPHAAPPFAGNPPVARFAPRLDVYPQNFALAQSPDGVLYVGNLEGVLTFDGERWDVTPLPNGDLVRSLAADATGRIYVGGYNQFGYLERDATGREHFHDLTGKFQALLDGEAFADIWEILVAPEGVFFRGVHHIFLYVPQSGEVMMWRREARFGGITRYDGDVILQFRGEGLRRFVATGTGGARWEVLPGTESLQELVVEYVPLPDGGLLLLSNDGEWRQYAGGRLSAFVMPAGFPPSSDFTRGMLTRDKRLALSTPDGALVILDPVTGGVRRFDVATGFISALVPARGGGIFMLSNDALLHIDWPARWTVLGKEHGLAGSTYNVAKWGERWFLLTGAGVREWRPDGAHFVERGWTQHAAWDLLPLDDDSALLAGTYALNLVTGGTSKPVTHNALYPRLLQRSVFEPDIVYAGTEIGLAVLRRDGNTWRLVLEVDDIDAPRVNSIVQAGPHELWLGSDRGGVMHVKLSEALDAVESLAVSGAPDGIAYGKLREAFVARLPGGMIASTARGIFRYNGERFAADTLGGLEALRGDDEVLHFALAPDGVLWAYSFNHVFSRNPGERWLQHDIGAQLRGAISGIAFDARSGAILVSSSGILRHRPVTAGGYETQPPRVALRAVERVDSDGSVTRLPLRTGKPLEFGADGINIAFRFSLPEYGLEKGARYSARLDGLEPQWSDWSTGSGFMYYRMRPGSYSLLLRARDSQGRITAIDPWRFRVVPPWYASALAIAAWLLLAAFLVLFFVQWILRRRTSRLADEKRRLETMVAERTQALEDANRKLEAIAHLDGLTGISNRRRLDAYLEHVWTQCAARERALAVLVIDVDHFKRYNDRHGHVAGDRLLQKLANILARCLRRSEDLAARYGGEEFLVVLPGADLAAARELADHIRETVENSSLGATVSIGLAAAVPGRAGSVTDLVRKADAALYEAKAANRNCVRASTAEGDIR